MDGWKRLQSKHERDQVCRGEKGLDCLPQSTETFINPAPRRLQRDLSTPLRALRGHPSRIVSPLWQKRKQGNFLAPGSLPEPV